MTSRETRHLDTRHLGRSILLFDEVRSTNDLAASMAHDADFGGMVFVAGHQSQGRGQYGRLWQARPGASLLMSVLLFPPPELRRPAILTAWAAVGVAEAIADLADAPVHIKWPNDLLVSGRKICGILIEQSGAVVIGIGLNLNQTAEEFAANGLLEATSLGIVLGKAPDPAPVLEAVVHRLDEWYDRLLWGDLVTLQSAWKQRLGLLGRPVRVDLADGTTRFGRLRDMTFYGVELETGGYTADTIRPELIRGLGAVS